MKPTVATLQKLDVVYARYNALKTFSDVRESQFINQSVGPFVMTKDATRSDSYYNRILGLNRYNIDQLSEVMNCFPPSAQALRVDIPAAEAAVVREQLCQLGFQQTETISWLWAHPGERLLPVSVTLLPPDQIGRLRPLFETERPLPDDLWDTRSPHLSTTIFQTFVIEENSALVAMASIFLENNMALLGNAFTLPSHRGRGYQQALLQARLNYAHQRQIKLAWVDVTTKTSSERNCRRVGFKPFADFEAWEFHLT